MKPLVFASRIARYAWAGPNTALGLLAGMSALLLGARWRRRQGALEFGGGRLGRWCARLPPPLRFSAITLGHVILGVDAATLDAVRSHEQVHVRQYERWGPLFLPAYLASSLLQLLLGRRPYLDNGFEREAFARTGGTGARAADADDRDGTPGW